MRHFPSLLAICLLVASCWRTGGFAVGRSGLPVADRDGGAVALETVASFPDRGADADGSSRSAYYGPREDPSSRALRLAADLPTLTGELRAALETQRALLTRQSGRRSYEVGGRAVTPRDFIRVIDALLSGAYLSEPLEAVPVAEGGSVRFTGYYSPVVEVRREATADYRYPLLRRPAAIEGGWPDRSAIERGVAFAHDEYAIAWAKHPLDVYDLQLQGSGFVEFGDGVRRYLAYGGTNRYPYRSIELALERRDSSVADLSLRGLREWIDDDPEVRDTITRFNPNYGFFRLADGEARGAAGTPLTPWVSVAADPRHYPLGSVLLARVPVPGIPGRYVTRLLLVQDTGGAIRGEDHLDLYTGVGERGLDIAEVTAGYGEVYVLGPRGELGPERAPEPRP